ncbi:hypothetical protein [Priestia megaterium]|uniref:GHMP family kinase ATP-binding protein n=1 Tax=Priestia megaterium TaxID=1404 RepID=UPI0005C6F907|nr:hypothetical protein [Priestia megaterium]
MEQVIVANNKEICVTSEACGTFGELLQGELPSNRNFLVTLPIKLKTRATFIPNLSENKIKVVPTQKKKVITAISYLKEYLNIDIGGLLIIQSEIPEGKGLASSSADIVASLRCILKYLKIEEEAWILEDIMCKIEPTDGIMYSESVFYYHKEVKLGEKLGALPPMIIIASDEGGLIDTVNYNNCLKPYTSAQKEAYLDLLHTITIAIKERDIDQIGHVSTLSAKLNQERLYKSNLNLFLSLNRLEGVCGTVTAHSGTMIGSIIDPTSQEASNSIQTILNEFSKLRLIPKLYSNI